MKTMTCEQTGGACHVAFSGNTLEEIAQQSKQHAMEMVQQGDQAHAAKMEEMKAIMTKPDAMQEWHSKIQAAFDNLPEDNQ